MFFIYNLATLTVYLKAIEMSMLPHVFLFAESFLTIKFGDWKFFSVAKKEVNIRIRVSRCTLTVF